MISTKEKVNTGGALIGYENLLTSAYVVGDSSTPSDALSANTYQRWRPTATTVTARFQLSELTDVDFIGIAGHNLTGVSVLIRTATSVGGALTDLESITPTNNSAIMINFDTVNIREIVLVMTLSAPNEIAVVSCGRALQMPRSIYGGHSPMALSQDTTFHNSISEGGNILGRTIIRQGLSGQLKWQFLDDEWYRDSFQPFVVSARTMPFFLKWRPDFYSDETVYGFTTNDIKPNNSGGGNRMMDVSISITGHADS